MCGGADDSPGAELGAELRGLGVSSGGMRARENARDDASPEPKDDDHDGAGEEQPLVRPRLRFSLCSAATVSGLI